MAEPISKKSGAYLWKGRKRKIELEEIEVSKTKRLTNFFKPTDQCGVLNQPSLEQSQQLSTLNESVFQVGSNKNLQEPETQIGI